MWRKGSRVHALEAWDVVWHSRPSDNVLEDHWQWGVCTLYPTVAAATGETYSCCVLVLSFLFPLDFAMLLDLATAIFENIYDACAVFCNLKRLWF